MQAVRSITRMLSGVRLAAAPASSPSYVIAAAHRRAAAAPASPCYLAQHVTPSNGISAASAMSTVVLSALGGSLGNRMVKEAPVKTMTSSGGRSISCTAARATGLNDFFVSFPDVDKDGKPMYPAVGRAWKASELRQKSFEDLHKLWWILLKERNSLAAERHAARARGLQIPAPRRIRKVRKSMSRIMCVLGERKRMKELIRSQLSSDKEGAATQAVRRAQEGGLD